MTPHRPKIGIILPMFSGDPAKVLDAARSAEELGFDGVFAFDHFFPPGGSPDKPALEAFTTLAAVAQATQRVSIGTLVTRAILRPPGMLAKLTATLDQISQGRMILGLGTGDPIDRPEHHAFGFPDLKPKERRAHLQETVSALKALFEGKLFQGGDHIPRIEGPLVPPPIHPPPIWLGALSDEIVKIAAHVADGWNGWGLDPAAFGQKAKLLAAEADQAGRKAEATWAGIVLVGEDDAEAERFAEARRRKNMIDAVSWMGGVDRFAEHIHDLASAGATWVVMVLAGPAGRRELLAERVLSAL